MDSCPHGSSNGSGDYRPCLHPTFAAPTQAFFSAYGHAIKHVNVLTSGPCSGAANAPTCDIVSYSIPTDAGGGSPQNTTMEVARVDFTSATAPR